MSVHWTIQFKSLRTSTLYTVSIYDADYSGDPIPLKGGAQPFVTDEDDDTDMFAPVRTQSGTLSIVDDGKDANGNTFSWTDLLPETDTSRPVTLTHVENNTTITDWQGYIQAQTYGGDLYGGTQERSFSIQDSLGLCQGIDINYQHTQLSNFAYLLKYMIDQMTGLTFSYVYFFPGSMPYLNLDYMMKLIDWQNFVVENDDGLEPRFSLGVCLEDMCTFWGMTIRTAGDSIYLIHTDLIERSGWVSGFRLTMANLATLAAGTFAGTDVRYMFTDNIDDHDVFANTDNDIMQMRGVNKVIISADMNAADSQVIDTTSDAFYDATIAQGWGSASKDYDLGGERYTIDLQQFSLAFLTGTAVSGVAAFATGRLYEKNLQDFNDYSMVRVKTVYDGAVKASLQTVYEHCFSGDHISLSAKFFYRYYQFVGEPIYTVGTVKMRIGIGRTRQTAMWLNVSSSDPSVSPTWESTPQTIDMLIGRDDGKMYFFNGQPSVAVPSGYTGLVFIDVMGTTQLKLVNENIGSLYVNTFNMADFKVNVYHGISDIIDPDNAELSNGLVSHYDYKATNSGKFARTDITIDTVYGSNRSNFSRCYGVLVNPNGTYLGTINGQNPEQLLANRIAAFNARGRKLITCHVSADRQVRVGEGADLHLTSIGSLVPSAVVRLNATDYAPISISHVWRDDIIQLTLLEL